jgi:tetratricopeptide (TPR) repeat protein
VAPGDETIAPESLSIRGYDVSSLLGQGGFARVVEARRVEDGRIVALKVGHRPHDQRFAREAEALRALAGSRAAPALFGEGHTEDGRPYLVLERLEGQTLAAWQGALPGAGSATRDELSRILPGLCEAVDQVHAAGLVHRDLKPENVFLDEDGAVTLLDFGLALSPRARDAALTSTGQRLGTVLYMAPEQCLDAREVGPRADIYALGVVLFELLTGRPPFVGDAAQVAQAHVARRPPRPSELAALPSAVDDLLFACLAKEPGHRPEKAREVLASLEAALAEAVEAARTPTTRAASRRQTVALLGVGWTARSIDLESVIRTEGGRIARFAGDRRLVALTEQASPQASVEAAVRLARRLSPRARGAIVVHAAELRVREGASLSLAGTPLEKPLWWKDEAASGIWLTPEAAALVGQEADRLVRVDEPAGTTETALPEVATPTLVGRDELVATLCLERAQAHAECVPTLSTVVGDVGMGKTRLAQALSQELHPGLVIHACAPPPETGDPDRLLVTLLRAALRLEGGAVEPATLEKSCGASFAAVALVLGILPDTDPRVARILCAPGALRYAVAKALGDALTRLAETQPLAVCIDDAHWADPATLDALEVATLAEARVPLWVCVVTRPALTDLRPTWGDRAGRYAVHALGPLGADAMRALLLELFAPVEFLPKPVLERLEEMAQGVPLYLVEIVHALRASGAIRRQPGSQGWYVASDELLRVSATPVSERLAERSLARLPASLLPLLSLCAVVGDEVSAVELDAIGRATAGPESVDAGVGLSRLLRVGVMRPAHDGRFAFRHSLLRRAIEAALPLAEKQRLHQAVLDQVRCQGRSHAWLARVARHAAACGKKTEAAQAHLDLADEARARHRYVEADEHYTAALEQLGEAAAAPRMRALGGRGRMRYRLQRFHDSLADLRAARSIAEASGDAWTTVDLLLEEATALDWLKHHTPGAAIVDRLPPLIASVGDPLLEARYRMALGRTRFLQARIDEAMTHLSYAAERATALGDYECRVIALLLLVMAESSAGCLDEAERHGEEVVALCQAAGDALHLGVAYINRVFLWEKRQQYDRAVADQQAAVHLARELGHAFLEKQATFNLAELLYWMGSLDEALPFAERVHSLQLRVNMDVPNPDDGVLLARIALARGDYANARIHLAWVTEHCADDLYPPWTRTLRRMIELVLADKASCEPLDPWMWDELIADARRTSVLHEHMEVLYVTTQVALERGQRDLADRRLAQALQAAAALPLWQHRLSCLERKFS